MIRLFVFLKSCLVRLLGGNNSSQVYHQSEVERQNTARIFSATSLIIEEKSAEVVRPTSEL